MNYVTFVFVNTQICQILCICPTHVFVRTTSSGTISLWCWDELNFVTLSLNRTQSKLFFLLSSYWWYWTPNSEVQSGRGVLEFLDRIHGTCMKWLLRMRNDLIHVRNNGYNTFMRILRQQVVFDSIRNSRQCKWCDIVAPQHLEMVRFET